MSFLMVAVLSGVCLLQWKVIGKEKNNLSKILDQGILQLERKLDLANSRWNSLLDSLVKDRKSTEDLLERYISKQSEIKSLGQELISEKKDSVEDNNKDLTEDLPKIPQGINPQAILALELQDLLKDERINPEKRRLNRIENAEGQTELVRAQGMLKVLDCEILEEAAKLALNDMLDFLEKEKHLNRADAYVLASDAVDLQITQLVDGKKGVHALLPKRIFVK